MSDDSVIKADPTFTIDSTGSTPATTETKDAATSAEIGKDEFLTLLVHQLQNQDPLDPMKNEEFAVQLAQFTQVEQLIELNSKLSGALSSENPAASMASFLGHEVVLNSQQVNIQGGEAPNLLVDIPEGTRSARVDLLDENGGVVATVDLGEVESGKQTVSLEGVDAPNGTYSARVVSVDAQGQFVDLESKVTGTVEGFVLEPTPALLVGGEQIALEDVVEVHVAQKTG